MSIRYCRFTLSESAAIMVTLFRAGTVAMILATPLYGAVAAANPPQVKTQEAQRQPIIEQIKANGTVVSLRDAAVSSAVSGRVTELHADIGDTVAAGAVLLSLDTEIAAAQLRAARAEAAEAEAALADARRRLREARNLEAVEGISQSEIRSLEAEVAMDEQSLERLRAAAEHRQAEMDRHQVKAPFSGVISRRMVDPGEWVEPGTGVVELVDMDSLRLDFRLGQRYFPRLSSDTELTVALEAMPDRRFPARIRAIAPVNDPQSRTFLVRTELAETGLPITPGMAARARFSLDTGRNSVVISRNALLRHPDGRTTVWTIVEEDGKTTVAERRVETGLTFDARVEIRSGLEPGAAVVITGNEALSAGQQVRTTENGEN